MTIREAGITRAPRQRPSVADLIALGGVSAALLALEVLLLRLFEFSHWYHFAGMAVSLALLGLGAAGTTLAVAGHRQWVRGDGWFLAGLLLTAFGFLLLLLLQSQIALRPVFAGWDGSELGKLLLVDMIAFLPFYGAGLVIGQVFLRWPGQARSLYAANLLGSGLGSIAATGMLLVLPVETALAVAALVLFGLGLVLALQRAQRTGAGIAAGGLLLALAAVVQPPAPAVSDFKALSRISERPGVETLISRPGLAGRLTVFRADSLRVAPGLSLNWQEQVPPVDVAVIGSDRRLPLPRQWPPAVAHAQASLPGLPAQLRPAGPMLVLGSSAWQTPLMSGPRSLTWVEPDGRILDLVATRGGREAGIDPVEDGIWRHLGRHQDPAHAVIALDAAYAGGNAAGEDYSLTARGLERALERLLPDGLLAIPLAMNYPPRHYPRLMATLNRALRAHGATEPGRQVAVLRSMQSLLILASPNPLAESDTGAIRDFAERWRFDIAWLSGFEREQANRYHRLESPLFHDIAEAVFAGRPLPALAQRFHTEGVTLDRPYPWRSIAWDKVGRLLEEQGQRGWSYLDWTLILSLVTAGVATLLAFLFILAPLGRLPAIGRPFTRVSVAAHFTALGLAYMLVELALFQRLILYLGEPVLTASLVFATFLIGSGIGSSMTPRDTGRTGLSRIYAALAIGALVALIPFFAVDSISAPALPLRLALLVALLLPLAWAMGRPFPWALNRLEGQDRWIPWAWGINGFASVVAASLAPLISVHFGQHLTLAAGAACYLLAFVVARGRLATSATEART